MSKLLLFALIASCSLGSAFACSCMAPSSASDYFCEANFAGILTITGEPWQCGFMQKCYQFKLVRPLKVDTTRLRRLSLNATVIKTPEDEAMCGVSFESNEDYLVAGNINEDTGELALYLCSLIEDWTHMPSDRRISYLSLFEPRLFCGEREDA